MTQNPNEFHQELYALSMRAVINASTYTACIVNGVKFMVLDRDSQRTTQNSGVSVEDENNVKHYGQLEEIIEIMVSIWIFLMYVMADVMGRGHGGDGAEDPHHPFGRGEGQHEMDFVSRKKTRGKAKNLNLKKLVDEVGPLSLSFDRRATFSLVGKVGAAFVREAGIYIWRSIPFDKDSWDKVSDAHRAALLEHLKTLFNIDEIERDQDAMNSIRSEIQKWYRDRKSDAKKIFIKEGGYNDVQRALDHVREGMEAHNWKKAVEYFHTSRHLKSSASNKGCRTQQKFPNRAGTVKLSSICFEEDKDRVEVYRAAHTDKTGKFDCPESEMHYQQLKQAFEKCTQTQTDPNEVQIFEDEFGPRRGYIRGMGRKPPSKAMPNFYRGESSRQPSRSKEKEEVERMLEDSSFRSQLLDLMRSYKAQNDGRNDEDEDPDID